MKKSFKITLVLISILLLVAVGLFFLSKYLKQEDKEVKVEVMDSIADYGYTLDSLDSEVFKEEFLILKELLSLDNVDYDLYAKSLAKLFAIDLYTLETKIHKGDVGGAEYIHSTKKEVYKTKMMNEMYKELKDNSSNNRNQELPYVSSVEVIEAIQSKYKTTEEVDSYEVTVEITYKKDMGYDSKIKVILVREDKKLVIAEFKPVVEE